MTICAEFAGRDKSTCTRGIACVCKKESEKTKNTIRRAWADYCGLSIDDERVDYGWPDDFKVFAAGWNAARAGMDRLERIEFAAMSCDGIDMGDYYQVPVAAFEDLISALTRHKS